MNTQVAESEAQPGSKLVSMMAQEANLDAKMFASTVQATCFDGTATREQFVAFLMIAHEHKLNPITREIYAFAKGGKITPIVSIDGWLKIINSHPDFLGMEFEDHMDEEGKISAITCRIFRKRNGEPSDHPTQVTEYLSECHRNTEPWNKWPIRMLRHKSTIQCARYAFGFSGIVDADEAERIKSTDITGTATIVDEEIPQNAATRLISKIKPQVEDTDLAAETENPAPVEAQTTEEAIVEGESLSIKDTAGHNTAGEIITEDGEVVAVEDIPGLSKGSDIKKPTGKKKPQDQSNDEFVKDLK